MPFDGTAPLLRDADTLRRIAEHLEQNVADEDYRQSDLRYCAMGHAIAAGIVPSWEGGMTQRLWASGRMVRLFGACPTSRTRQQAIDLLRLHASEMEEEQRG